MKDSEPMNELSHYVFRMTRKARMGNYCNPGKHGWGHVSGDGKKKKAIRSAQRHECCEAV